MQKRLSWRLTMLGLLVVAVVILVVSPALGGPSLRKLVKQEVAKQLRGKVGPQGPAGQPGQPGPPSGPRAFARLTGFTTSDTVDESRSSGIADANVVRQAAGLYCFYNLGFTPRHVQVTEALVNSPGNATYRPFAEITTGTNDSGDCPNTPNGQESVEVFIDSDGNALGSFVGVDAPVYVALFD